MPIRLPDIPNLASTASAPDLVDPSAATAPARALGSVAQGIANVSGAFADEAERIQRMENARIESGARQQWMQGWGQLQAELETDPDPASHIARTDAFLQEQKATLDQPDMSESAREALSLQYDEFATRAKNAATGGAANLANRRAALTLTNELEEAERTGNPAMFERGLKTAQDAGVVLPEQAGKLRSDFARTVRKNNLIAQAIDSPDLFLEEHKERPDGIDPVEWQNITGTAKRNLAQQTADTVDQIQDGIAAGNITRPEQIDDLAPGMRPAAREQLKTNLARRADANLRALQATPGYQASTVSKVEELLDRYTVDTDDYDTAYAEMDGLVRSLPEGSAVRAELTRRLTESRNGQVRQLETAADFHRQALTELTKQGAFGTGTISKPIEQILTDGILRDPAKITARGFTPEQAAIITSGTASAGDLEALGVPEKTAKALAGKGDTEARRVALFRALSGSRAGFDKSTEYERAALDAIESGKAGFVEVADLAAREKQRRAAGLAKTKLEAWLKANPNADEAKGREALLNITGELAIPGAVESILTAPPAFLDGIDIDGTLLPPPPQ